jgi:hypothetical protein
MTWELAISPVVKKLKTMQSLGKVAAVFWYGYRVLLVDFAPLSSTINAAACQKALITLNEIIQQKRPGGILLCDSARPHSVAATISSLNSWGLEIFPCPPCSHDLHCWTFIGSKRWKSTSEVSASTSLKVVEMKSRNGYMPRTHFLSMKDLTN